MVSFGRFAILSFCQHQSQHLQLSRKHLLNPRHSSLPSPSTVVFLLSTTTSVLTGISGSRSITSSSPSNLDAKPNGCVRNMSSSNNNGDDDKIISTGYLNAKDAYDLDQQLFSTGYTLEQLMELAGLSVAEAVYDVSPPSSSQKKKKVLIVCGPGNNGGDGLVAARHLVMFGYDVVVVYPKRSSREIHYSKLVKQCEDVGVKVVDAIPESKIDADKDEVLVPSENQDTNMIKEFDVIVDAIFGFSFKGEAREPFATIINKMIELQHLQKIPIVAVDVPSGWNVDEGDVANTGMVPDVLVSLTAPKLCSKEFKGRHFVGGRFLPPAIADKYGIQMPPYPGVQQVMEITSDTLIQPVNDDDWALQYASYCAEKEAEELKSRSNIDQLEKEDDDWALQYQNYCIEKEAKLKEEEEKAKEKMNMDNEEDWEKEYAKYLREKDECEKERVEKNDKSS